MGRSEASNRDYRVPRTETVRDVISKSTNTGKPRFHRGFLHVFDLKPKEGFEPSTPALRKRCSAIELLRRGAHLDAGW
jgi:hypothetical protein